MHSSSGDPSRPLTYKAAEETLANIVKALLGHAPDFAVARKEQPDPGTFLWSWGEGPGLRTFKNFAFRDADHATVLLALMRRGDALRGAAYLFPARLVPAATREAPLT